MKVLLVTIVIGDEYLATYNKLFRSSQEEYAKKHDYDFKVLTDYLYPHLKHPGTIYFNKILVCSQEWSANYDFIIFIDADILINIHSPPIHTVVDFGDKIGMADEFSQPTSELRLKIQEKLGYETSAKAFYKLAGFDLETTKVFNSGVLVLQPKHHKLYLENIFKSYVLKAIDHPRGPLFEQSSIGYELQKDNKYVLLPNEFNVIWFYYKVLGVSLVELFQKGCFIHFAGRTDFDAVELLHPLNTTA